ncbi:hypothetical protein V6615_10100 [Oscillospiraceae bacterium PP1C4]
MSKKVISALGFGVLLLSGCANDSASVGVIGGADGPTAVFVASSASPSGYVAGGIVVLAALAVGAFILWRRHK